MRKEAIYIIIALFSVLFFNQLTAQSNSANPYDKIGQIHNKVVKDFLQNYGDKDLSEEEVLNISSQLCEKYGLPKPHLTQEQLSLLKEIIRGSSDFAGIASKVNVSKNATKYLTQLFSIIDKEGKEESVQYNQIYKAIIKIEETILNDESLPKNERKMLLESTSIMRHSLYLWNTHIGNTAGKKRKCCKWLRWLAVAGADVAGFLLSDGNVSASVSASNFVYTITK